MPGVRSSEDTPTAGGVGETFAGDTELKQQQQQHAPGGAALPAEPPARICREASLAKPTWRLADIFPSPRSEEFVETECRLPACRKPFTGALWRPGSKPGVAGSLLQDSPPPRVRVDPEHKECAWGWTGGPAVGCLLDCAHSSPYQQFPSGLWGACAAPDNALK